MSTSTGILSLDDRSDAIKFSYPVVALFSTSFVMLRIGYNVRFRRQRHRYVEVSDCLLAFAQACALVGASFGFISAWKGAGKHAWDPSLTTDDLTKYLQYLWFSQYFNLTAMVALKLSISAFMLGFSFSKIYRRLIWATVATLVVLNVIFPYIILFGECNPIAKHWEPKLPGYCWGPTPRTISGYLGAGSNIISDLFYTCAPLVYIRNVQLTKRAKWGLRVVFLLGLITTVISAVKLYEIKALNETTDAAYESINLSVLSVTEVFVGTLTASLPPLRLFFEKLLDIVLAKLGLRTRDGPHTDSYVLPNILSTQATEKATERANTKQLPRDSDDDSQEILWSAITRTHHITVKVEAAEIKSDHSNCLKNNWS
ncbi:hypothetical protein E8E12_001705 [Didymella heteroderae]|uniref:Rhodopsin domain-containing protein n=1 Tax=Didymella heteroderae TaxID=1769908 RepID=A0A9P4WG12_9PLEO|nr:hypothetical protein E8E12_001705 [Didymella heteroderae]